MSKQNDSRATDGTKRRSSSSPKPGETSDIPKIILDQKRKASSSLPSSLQTSLYSNTVTPGYSSSLPEDMTKNNVDERAHARYLCTGTCSNLPVRSSSDIELPSGKSSALISGNHMTSHENHIEIFCSPRTLRKSVDSNINTKEHVFYQWEKVQTLDSSNSSLKVLTSASRVDSALSLNSECTARSIGLLSTDSDSDKDLSLTEPDKTRFKPAQLRRFMSYPDEDASPELCARSSQSLGNLITSDNLVKYPDSGTNTVDRSTPESCFVEKTEPALASSSQTDSLYDLHMKEKLSAQTESTDVFRDHGRGVVRLPSNILSYKCDSHNSTRDIRIRQWLEGMDSDR